MALYYYININLSRINLKKNLSGGKEMYYCIYTRTYYTAIYIRKIQATHGAKRKKERGIYIEKHNQPLSKMLFIYIHKKNTTNII